MAHGRVRTASGVTNPGAFSDLSEHGCRFLFNGFPGSTGDLVRVWLQRVGPFEGMIRWRSKAEVGIEFTQPIYKPVYDHLVAELGWSAATSQRGAR